MFTGLITDLGSVQHVERKGTEARFTFATRYDHMTIAMGASIACNGCCLTVIARGPGWFAVEASTETLAKTTLGFWRPGTPVNFERALRMGDELGGHLVSGHVDGVATVADVRPDGASHRMTFVPPKALVRFVAPKGSVALDGVSLTLNEVEAETFGVNIIPHTQKVTTFGLLRPGDRVNMEIDLLARYVARLVGND